MGIVGNRSTDRTLTTHVGSLIRPDDLVAALQARRARWRCALGRWTTPSSTSCCRAASTRSCGSRPRSGSTSSATVSSARRSAGRATSSNGSTGSRTAPIRQPPTATPTRPLGPRTDIEQFPEFYAEYNSTQGFEEVMRNPVCVGPISYAGHDALQRDIANFTLAVDAARAAGHDVSRLPPRGRAGERRLQAPGRPLRVGGGVRLRRRRRPRARSTGRSSTPG